MNAIEYTSIGVVHSPFAEPKGTPIQAKGGKGIAGTVEVFPKYADGVKDLDGFSHIILIYHFHQSEGYSLEVKPYLDDRKHGVFATRAPSRPNPIGVSVVRLDKIVGNTLHIRDIDIIDGTPLLDIKPYIPEIDASEVDRIGWLEDRVKRLGEAIDDGRFVRW